MLGLVIIVLFVFVALIAPLIAPYGPLEGALANGLKPPSPQHLMGTDKQGRDELSARPVRRTGEPRRRRSPR